LAWSARAVAAKASRCAQSCRIIQEPGRIEGGKVIVYFNEEDRNQGTDLLQQAEAYMQELQRQSDLDDLPGAERRLKPYSVDRRSDFREFL
jgi:hypothetical protein